MAFRFADSFDDRSSAQLLSKYTSGFAFPIIASGRNSTQCLRINGTSATGIVQTMSMVVAGQCIWIIGAAIRIKAIGSQAIILYEFQDAGSLQCKIYLNLDGTLTIHRNGAAIAAPTNVGIQTDVWTYVEVKVKVAGSGYCIIHFDGVEVLSTGAIDTTLTANDFANSVTIGSGLAFGGFDAYMDDLYICDVGGGVNDDFLGDVRIECLNPTSAGNYAEWTPSPVVANYQNVDDPASPGPDGDTTYNTSYLLSARDSFAFSNLSTVSGAVAAVAVNLYARKTDAGARGMKAFARLGGVDYDNAETESVDDTYSMKQSVYDVDPSDTSAWSIPDVNNAEFGYKLES